MKKFKDLLIVVLCTTAITVLGFLLVVISITGTAVIGAKLMGG